MIFDSYSEGSASSSSPEIEVEVRVRVSKENSTSTNSLMSHANMALHGALVGVGMLNVQQVMDTWHEERADESRAEREI